MKLVLDTSTFVKWFFKEEFTAESREILGLLQKDAVSVYLPELAKYEFGNILVKGKRIPYNKAKKFVSNFNCLPIFFVKASPELMQVSLKIALDKNITFYDASFIAVAKIFTGVLVSADKHHDKIGNAGIDIVHLSEFSQYHEQNSSNK